MLTIPDKPCSWKNRWTIGRVAGRPCVVLGRDAKEWKAGAVAALEYQWKGPPLEGPVAARVIVYQAKGQNIDIDNALGGVFDALQAARVLKNDYQIETVWADRRRDRERPRIEIELEKKGEA